MSSFMSNLTNCIPQSTMPWTTDISDVDDIIRDFYRLNNPKGKLTFKQEIILVTSILERCNKYEAEIISRVEEGNLKDIPVAHRRAFGASSLVKAHTTLRRVDSDSLELAIITMDKAMLIGVPSKGWNVPEAIDLIHAQLGQQRYYSNDERTLTYCRSYSSDEDESDGLNGEEEDIKQTTFPYTKESLSADDIGVEDKPSVSKFMSDFMECDEPVKLTNCMTEWAALVKWKYFGYLKRIAGVRLVPIEMGDYSRGGRVRLITLAEYLDDLGGNKTAEEIGYLAQHQLFDQEPKLQQDIVVPTYCACGTADDVTMNVWLGPAKTYSPLHKDPQPNILAQVVGRKTVTLFAPSDTPFLYPGTTSHTNTSQVDIRDPDFEAFPDFDEATPLLCTLNPGEMLFIPAEWWHAVESLDTSFSVNFFF